MKKAAEVSIGTKVRMFGNTCEGTVIGNQLPSGDEIIAIEWGSGSLTRENVNDVEEVPNEMESDFEKIRTLMRESILALQEAVTYADKHSMTLTDIDYKDGFSFYDLKDSVEDVVWNSSSII